jgi:murein DD-endopeptidase MepM/ murein hydrolase activator NlpD
MQAIRKASPLRGLLLLLLGGLVGANATYFVMTRNSGSMSTAPAVARSESVQAPSDALPAPVGHSESSPHDTAPLLPAPVPNMHGTPIPTTQTPSAASGSGLLIPVQGIAASQLSDTFTDARSAGRSHDAIDIMAPAGTPVLAVADGHVEKLFTSKLGGLTVYEFNADNTMAYYYAHLQRYAEGLAEQQVVKRGQLLGYVGSTGDASPGAPHLHFAISVLGPEKQWWKGEAINPYPLLGGAPH